MTIPHVTYQIPSYGPEKSPEPSLSGHEQQLPEFGPLSREARVSELALIGKDIYTLRQKHIESKRSRTTMGAFFARLLVGPAPKSNRSQDSAYEQYMRQLVNAESIIGDAIVGRDSTVVIAQHFFLSHIADNEWIWRQHERGKEEPQTITYVMSQDGVMYRSLKDSAPAPVSDVEFEHVWLAINQYKDEVAAKIYQPGVAR